MICKMNVSGMSPDRIGEHMYDTLHKMEGSQLFTKQYLIPTNEQTSINFVTINTETGVIHSTCNKDELITWDDIKLLEYLDNFEKTYIKRNENVQNTK